MSTQPNPEAQQQVITALKSRPSIDPVEEINRRVTFLREHMEASGQHTLVLGISGGVDSSVGGRLAQKAVEAARKQGMDDARFVAMRLPYGEQQDEADAQMALEFIGPDEVLTVDVKPASDAMLNALEQGGLEFRDAGHRDFVMGNIKARQRMVAQYAVAGARSGLVIGTDQAAEALMGFFTKYGDGACDLTPLTGLNKRQVRALARALEAPARLVEKHPTADLETLTPGKTDEDAFGIRYDEIDDFLEGKPVSDNTRAVILKAYKNTEHKRNLPLEPL
ncbi:ammonia-dependent NAD(+) synthetase [Hydrocarboniclastica marina]|uniref:NH(3)-dependent NAD(+) synthetase n=1 Tax=Hydrocarboniclastica marina TaxID=2259620 RepID=A0A4P7XFH3_9ALTE|nr:ammonia-dependent NAD(+) synthetase [Hydrocarboniclastica marina]QCF25435.1 ammonia-dependent NAD(+) synthetase [Hydrocarboniclastica marina]